MISTTILPGFTSLAGPGLVPARVASTKVFLEENIAGVQGWRAWKSSEQSQRCGPFNSIGFHGFLWDNNGTWRFILLEEFRSFRFPVISGVSSVSCHLTVRHCQVGPSPNPENLKMLALRHFGSCGYLREFCGNLRDFARVIPTFSVAAFTLLNSTLRP